MSLQKPFVDAIILLPLVLLGLNVGDLLRAEHVTGTRLAITLMHGLLLVLLIYCLHRATRRHTVRLSTLNLQLKTALRRAQDIIECSSDLVWETDASGCFTFVSDHNQIMHHITQPRVMVGTFVRDLAASDPLTPRAAWVQQMAENAMGLPMRDFCFSLPMTDGGVAHFRVNAVPIWADDRTLLGFRGTTRDRTAEIEALQSLHFQALHDPLTGLPNRRSLQLALDQVVVARERQAAVLLLDLDGFKTVNDIHGHAAGDELLRLFAERLSTSVRPIDTLARLGGDEFGVIVPDLGEARVMEMSRRLVSTLSLPYLLRDHTQVRVGVSIGVVRIPDHGIDPDMLLRCADQTLYDVKHSGGNAVRAYRPRADAEAGAVTAMTALEELRSLTALPGELQNALLQNELWLAYQPIRRCSDGSIVSMEALLRWTSPTRGCIAPDSFIPIAEESGLIVPIGAWVLREAAAAAVRAGGEWTISVNLSPAQFSQPDLALMIAATLRDTGLPAERLVLELTEQMPMSKYPAARETMRKLRSLGVSLALDDFGSGFSNIACLQDYRFDLLKLDRSILALDPAQRETVLAAVLDIARTFGMQTVVEGVEQPEDWEMLRRLGSDLVQGYLLGRPQADLSAVAGMQLSAIGSPPSEPDR